MNGRPQAVPPVTTKLASWRLSVSEGQSDDELYLQKSSNQ